jgi:hypothetical protein
MFWLPPTPVGRFMARVRCQGAGARGDEPTARLSKGVSADCPRVRRQEPIYYLAKSPSFA